MKMKKKATVSLIIIMVSHKINKYFHAKFRGHAIN